jgi:hypothetical protein
MAKRLQMLSFYEVFYRSWSNTAHGEGSMKRIGGRVEGGGTQLSPLRYPEGLQEKALNACHLTLGLTMTVVDKLIPHFREGFREWYAGHMKPALDYIGRVKFKC